MLVPEQLEACGARAPAEPPAAKSWEAPPLGDDPHRMHTDNFFACMRSRRQPSLDAQLGCQITAAIRLGVDAHRERRTLFFDVVAQRVANKAPRRPARKGDGKNYNG